jgi:hypothetical protein
MDYFSRQIEAEKQSFNIQESQFVFPPKPTLIKGNVIEPLPLKTKVLPLNMQNNKVESLYSDLPDDLRPANSDEVKTLMGLDCTNTAVGKYPDGRTGFQEKCQVYLFDLESSKFIGIQEFLGIMPALSKEKESENAVGKVMSEKYIAFLKEKQPENERSELQTATDSPNHHFFSKSEFIYALLFLCILAAIGFGWIANKIRFARTFD